MVATVRTTLRTPSVFFPLFRVFVRMFVFPSTTLDLFSPALAPPLVLAPLRLSSSVLVLDRRPILASALATLRAYPGPPRVPLLRFARN